MTTTDQSTAPGPRVRAAASDAGRAGRAGLVICVGVTVAAVLTGCTSLAPGSPAPATAPVTVASTAPATTAAPPIPSSSPPTTEPVPVPDPPAPPAVAPALMAQGAQSAQVRELQARLIQLKLFKGSPTGTFGKVTAESVTAFQTGRGLPPTGAVDQATWDALVAGTDAPTARELDPPMLVAGATGTKVRELQARLKQLSLWAGEVTPAYGASTTAAVRTFQGRRGLEVTGEVDRGTWAKLVSLTRTPTVYEMNNTSPAVVAAAQAAGLDARCLVGRVLCASKKARKLYWVIDGKIQLTLDARFGKAQFPSDNGHFTVYAKDRDAYSRKYDAPMPFALYYNGGEAVHYSSGFAAQGWNGGSHGCVNIRDKARMIWLFDQARVGDTVVVY